MSEKSENIIFKCYKQSFYHGSAKKISLKKLEDKIKSFSSKRIIGREELFATCKKFALLLKTDKNIEKNNPNTCEKIEKALDVEIKKIIQSDIAAFKTNNLTKTFLENNKLEDIFVHYTVSGTLAAQGLIYYFLNDYVSANIALKIEDLINKNPIDDYPTAREMKRHFVLHIGPTNSGKTYQSLERLKTCEKGIYLGPLRLLALEVYDKFNRDEVPCNLITGEEELRVDNAVCQASTIEMLNEYDYYDIAVIDEAQMISDKKRGYNWTKAILGICANEIHVCMAKSAENIVKKLIEMCDDTYEVHYHERLTPLEFKSAKKMLAKSFPYIKYSELKQGDAIIAFSKAMVLSISAEIEKHGIKTSVIYGNLPPSARKHQVELFTKGETKVVVATDAIGMGINLPIKRIIFSETEKFDGVQRRPLTSQEIKQIAGRAGRNGIYDVGYYMSLDDEEYVHKQYDEVDETVETAPLGFPDVLVPIPFELNQIISVWANVKVDKPFNKMDVADLLELYSEFNTIEKSTRKLATKHDIYNFITCPVDLKSKEVVNDWKKYCRLYLNNEKKYPIPAFFGSYNELSDLETYYKELDLYFQFSRRTKREIEFEKVSELKMDITNKINKILRENKSTALKKCAICGKPMMNSRYRYCISCYRNYFSYY